MTEMAKLRHEADTSTHNKMINPPNSNNGEYMMIDNVTLKVNDIPKNYDLLKFLGILRENDEKAYKCKLKNLTIWRNHDSITIIGSLAKYLYGENMTPLTREEVKRVIEKLELDIGLCLKNAIVCSVEFGANIFVKEKPFEYLNLFGHTKRLARHVFSEGYKNRLVRQKTSKPTGVQTVNYFTSTGSFGFIGYDKIKEMLAKKQTIPFEYDGLNVLRLEYKIRKRKGINAKFKRDLTAYCLFDEAVYRRFQKLFFKDYKNIEKMGQSIYTEKSTNMTPAKIVKLTAEQYRQNHPEEYQQTIQRLVEAGNITPKNLERIRAKSNKMGKDFYKSDENDLIIELDALVERKVLNT